MDSWGQKGDPEIGVWEAAAGQRQRRWAAGQHQPERLQGACSHTSALSLCRCKSRRQWCAPVAVQQVRFRVRAWVPARLPAESCLQRKQWFGGCPRRHQLGLGALARLSSLGPWLPSLRDC